MLLTILTCLLFLIPSANHHNTERWGKTGHRVIGEIASHYLTPKAKKAVKRILGPTSMAIASTWMDRIKSDPKWDYTHDWHWVTIPDGETYAKTKKNPNGDVISALRNIISDLRNGDLSLKEQRIKLKMLIHLVGDIHQPLHVGNGKDMGGNKVEVEWFYKDSNLHRVWDSEMIDDTKLSYTELADAVNHPTEKQIKEWQNSTVLDWARESKNLRDQVYDIPKDHELGYKYQYKNRDLLHRQLLKAGVRLAGVINDIYG
ncbi:MAG TPA: S1/P1 nuclease [Balneolaceae bacterium]|nr:S1/P1 nuclease [Balneolaceae bacterium]